MAGSAVCLPSPHAVQQSKLFSKIHIQGLLIFIWSHFATECWQHSHMRCPGRTVLVRVLSGDWSDPSVAQVVARLRRQLAQEQAAHREASAAFVAEVSARDALQHLLAACAARVHQNQHHLPPVQALAALPQHLQLELPWTVGQHGGSLLAGGHPRATTAPEAHAKRPYTAGARQQQNTGGVRGEGAHLTPYSRRPQPQQQSAQQPLWQELFDLPPRKGAVHRTSHTRTACAAVTPFTGREAACTGAAVCSAAQSAGDIATASSMEDQAAAVAALCSGTAVDAVQWLLQHAFGPQRIAQLQGVRCPAAVEPGL